MPEPDPDASSPRRSPIVVGGLGGSGTRVVVRILERLGVDMGHDRNREEDLLAFSLLFKRRDWALRQLRGDGEELRLACGLLERVLAGERPLPGAERRLVLRAGAEVFRDGHDGEGHGRGAWSLLRAYRVLCPRAPRAGRPLGLKEPNTHLFLEPLAAHFPGLRFVLVVRSGLDMAHSRNRVQLHLWGEHLGVTPSGDEELDQLRYWLAANRRAVELGTELLGARFHLLDYEALCVRPEETVRRLAEALDLPVVGHALEDCAALVAPSSRGRAGASAEGRYPRELLDEVRRFESEHLAAVVGGAA